MSYYKPSPLTVNVLYSMYNGEVVDCTNNGVTKRHNRVILLPEGVKAPENATIPVLKVVRRNIMGDIYIHAEPVTKVEGERVGWMAGGNFVYSSDSRYREWIGNYPIAVHDRCETVEDYNYLSV